MAIILKGFVIENESQLLKSEMISWDHSYGDIQPRGTAALGRVAATASLTAISRPW